MHGMINKSIQSFLTDIYGQETWEDIASRAGVAHTNFSSIFTYATEDTELILNAASAHLNKARSTLLEDLGTYLVTHPNTAAVRRLMRFGGTTFVEFLYSLDELPARARLALPDLDLPELTVTAENPQVFSVAIAHWKPGFSYVLVGILRALSDDYGALAVLDHAGRQNGVEKISILLADTNFADGKDFDLGLSA